MNGIVQIILLIPTTITVIFWVYYALKYEQKYKSITDSIDENQFRFCEFFYIGFQIMELIHFDIRSDKNRKKVSEMAEIYGRKYAEFYYYVMVGGEITYAVTLVPIVLLISILSDNLMALVFGLVLSVLLVWYVRETFNDQIEQRREELLLEFPQVLSKMTLLVNAGMVLRDAWKKVAMTGKGVIYQEMQITMQEFENGVSEIQAYQNFADRCALKEMRKFASLVTQGLSKGSADLANFLKEMADELWAEKRSMVMQKAAKAETKLLIPTILIFVGILILIIVPIFGSL